jgi:hypothetical protein
MITLALTIKRVRVYDDPLMLINAHDHSHITLLGFAILVYLAQAI